MSKKIRIDRTQGYILDNFLRENIETLNKKTPEKIARMCEKELGFEISPSTIKNTRKAMAAAGLEVWEFAPRGGNHNPKLAAKVAGLEKLIAEQDRKFAVVFAKLHALHALTTQEDEDYLPVANGDDDPEREVALGDLSWQ